MQVVAKTSLGCRNEAEEERSRNAISPDRIVPPQHRISETYLDHHALGLGDVDTDDNQAALLPEERSFQSNGAGQEFGSSNGAARQVADAGNSFQHNGSAKHFGSSNGSSRQAADSATGR